MARVGEISAEVAPADRDREMGTQRRMRERDPLEGGLDALRDGEARVLGRGGTPCAPGRPSGASRVQIDRRDLLPGSPEQRGQMAHAPAVAQPDGPSLEDDRPVVTPSCTSPGAVPLLSFATTCMIPLGCAPDLFTYTYFVPAPFTFHPTFATAS